MKSGKSTKIHKLSVRDKVYEGDSVSDGFFDSLQFLKAPDMAAIHSSSSFKNTKTDFHHIIKICESAKDIPEISYQQATNILLSLRSDVNDFYSMTPNHFINAGIAGFEHFWILLNSLISNINLYNLEELNTVWACILHKGHGKDKNSERSYRTISTCPLLAKALDVYVGQLYSQGWAIVQAPTQFQGSGSSHDLASLLLTECIQTSLHIVKRPLFVLLLDAKSAFDKVVRECAIRNTYLAGTTDKALLYINSRLANRRTFVEWDKVLMGPIHDSLGVEQGGVNSDKLYKLCNNVQLSTAQRSGLGLNLGSVVVSAIGQADDTVLVSDCLVKLRCLLHLAIQYCSQYHVELVPQKTKLLAIAPRSLAMELDIMKISTSLTLNGLKLSFTSDAEHVGVLRSNDGSNMPNILDRFSAHRNALRAMLPTYMSKAHRGSPASSLHLKCLYGTLVLLSGVIGYPPLPQGPPATTSTPPPRNT